MASHGKMQVREVRQVASASPHPDGHEKIKSAFSYKQPHSYPCCLSTSPYFIHYHLFQDMNCQYQPVWPFGQTEPCPPPKPAKSPRVRREPVAAVSQLQRRYPGAHGIHHLSLARSQASFPKGHETRAISRGRLGRGNARQFRHDNLLQLGRQRIHGAAHGLLQPARLFLDLGVILVESERCLEATQGQQVLV